MSDKQLHKLGIDIGSTTTKCVILQDGASITARSLQLGGLGTDGPEDALTELWQESGLTRADMARVIVTGYGRIAACLLTFQQNGCIRKRLMSNRVTYNTAKY